MKRQAVVVFFFLVLFATFFYFWRDCLQKDFIGSDDWEFYHDTFYRAGIIQPFDIQKITGSLGANAYYFPLETLTYNLLDATFGHVATPFYLFGFVLHSASAVFIYCIAMSLTKRRTVGILSSAIFLLYPPNIQTVSWIGAIMGQALPVFFYLFSVYFFIQFLLKKKSSYYVLSFVGFLLACLGKVLSLSFILVAMFADIFLFQNGSSDKKDSLFTRFCDWFDKYTPFIILGLFFAGVAVYKYPLGAISKMWGGANVGYFSLLRFFDFLALLVFPFFSNADRPAYIPCLALVIVTIPFLWKGRLARFFVSWTAASLLILTVSNFRDLTSLYRYLYLPSVPLAMLISHVALAGIEKAKHWVSNFHVS